jgi:hypothetical protein
MLSATFFFGTPQHAWNATVDDDVSTVETSDLNVVPRAIPLSLSAFVVVHCTTHCRADAQDWIGEKYGDYLEHQYNKSPYKLMYMWAGYDPLEVALQRPLDGL